MQKFCFVRSDPLIGRKSSANTEVVEMASDIKISSSSPSQPPEVQFKASSTLTASSAEVASPRITNSSPGRKVGDDARRDSLGSVQVPLDENRQRKSFIRRERRLFPPQTRHSMVNFSHLRKDGNNSNPDLMVLIL